MRIVIISCSNRKNKFPKATPAVEVYDGPYYKTIRKLLREGLFPEDTKILIISAKYGLISLEDSIKIYDEKISKERAKDLNTKFLERFNNEISCQCTELVINLGENYLPAIEGFEKLIPSNCKVKYLTGTIIARRQKLKEYLINDQRNAAD